MPSSANNLAVAILQSNEEAHLKQALHELGAAVVYEAPPANIDRDKLEGSGARVVIVNLDANSDDYIDQLYDVLDAGDYEVVFNDAQVSANLQGWDQARWARNLAAKLLHDPAAAEPPRPPGAEPVPTPAQAFEAHVPVAEKPGPVEAEPVALPPTIEMPVPQQMREIAPVEPAGLDIGALADFADLVAPPEPQLPPAPAPVAAIAENATALPGDFGAELDALFAAAEAKQPATPEPKAASTEEEAPATFEFDLPSEFNLADAPAETPGAEIVQGFADIDIPFEEPTFAAPPPPPPAPKAPPAKTPKLPPIEKAGPGGFDEFPAIFEQLDIAADDVPEATDTTFKPAALPEKPPASASSFPTDWGLEDLDLGADDAAKPAAAATKLERMSATDFLAPEVDESAAAKIQETMPADFGGLELMPMEDALQQQPAQAPASPNAPLKVGTGAGISRVFVLGASIGGPEAVRDFLGALPPRFPMLFVLAQHMGEEFLELMAAQLAKAVKLTVRKPTHGERVANGEVLIVPTTHRLQVDAEGVVTLAHLSEKSQYSPSIDQVLRDVADKFGDHAGAIVFSGMAHDAIDGSQYLKSRGGTVWVQDPDTCVVSSMVDGARAAGVVDFIGSPQQLAAKMIADYGKAEDRTWPN
jgi:two-component system chemotaxis response regulator CheB/chemosensory pili system protein ChpB (putative protein-glutamate methylesterase)